MNNVKIQNLNKIIKQKKIELIDLKSVDLAGRLHHVSLPIHDNILSDMINEGVGFDGSSYGFRKVENSDMILIPDLDTHVIDLFREAPTLSFYANVFLTGDDRKPFQMDGRYIAKQVEAMLKKYTGSDTSWWGPEFEFYIFHKVKYDTRTSASYYEVDHEEEFYHNAYHSANPFDV